MKRILPIFVLLAPAFALAADAPPPSPMEAATADLRARAAYAHAQVELATKFVAAHPAATRPVQYARDGRVAPDPRPTQAQALAAATKLADKSDTAVSNALGNLRAVPTDKDKDAFAKHLTVDRLQINETVELVLTALAETNYVSPRPAWLGAAARDLGAVDSPLLDKELSSAVFAAWQEQHPDNTGGIGVVGVGGKESMHAFTNGEKIGTLALVISPRISFRINPAGGPAKNPVPVTTPTTPNFTLQLLRPITINGAPLNEKSLLLRRASVWWTQPCPPDISAAAPAAATKPAN